MDKEQLLAHYFSGTLSEEQQEMFDTIMVSDVNFINEFEYQKRVQHAVVKKEQSQLKEKLQIFESDLASTKRKNVWWLAAASVIIIVASGFYFMRSDNSTETLFASYYQPAKNIVHPIVRNGDASNDLTTAFIAYQKQDYNAAERLFENAYQRTQKSELLFYQAISLIETDRADLAVALLTEHQKFTDDVSEKTQWYLALAYLKQGNSQAAKEILKEIMGQPEAFKHKEAQALFKKL